MGKIMKYIAVLALLCTTFYLHGNQIKRPLFSPVKVDFKLTAPPRVKVGAVSSSARGNVSLYNRRWGVVEISYMPHIGIDGTKRNKSRDAVAGAWLDDVYCGVRVIVCGNGKRKIEPWGAFTTRVQFWTIALDWKEHKYFVYLPPMLLERVMPLRRSDSRATLQAEANNFIVCVTFFHKKWGLLDEGYFGLKGRRAGEEFDELLRSVPAANVFHGALLSRANSPWGVNDQSMFDMEKPAFIPAPLDEAAIEKAAQNAAAEEATASAGGSKESHKSASGKKKSKRTSKK